MAGGQGGHWPLVAPAIGWPRGSIESGKRKRRSREMRWRAYRRRGREGAAEFRDDCAGGWAWRRPDFVMTPVLWCSTRDGKRRYDLGSSSRSSRRCRRRRSSWPAAQGQGEQGEARAASAPSYIGQGATMACRAHQGRRRRPAVVPPAPQRLWLGGPRWALAGQRLRRGAAGSGGRAGGVGPVGSAR
jgi:hypothetical protein